jgi:hypothetical protein
MYDLSRTVTNLVPPANAHHNADLQPAAGTNLSYRGLTFPAVPRANDVDGTNPRTAPEHRGVGSMLGGPGTTAN